MSDPAELGPNPAPVAPELTASEVAASEVAASELAWQRLDPRMLIVHPINELKTFLPFIIFAVLFGTGGGLRDTLIQVVAVVTPVLVGIWRYFTTGYRVSDTHIQLKRGLLARKTLTARIDRIRAVDIEASVVHRVLGLAQVSVSAGTSNIADDFGSGSLQLDSLRVDEANRLRTTLLERKARSTSTQESKASDEQLASTPGVNDDPSVGPLEADAPWPPQQPQPQPQPEEELLLSFDRRWARFAPLSGGGVILLAGGVGAMWQTAQMLKVDININLMRAEAWGPLILVAALLILIPLVAMLSIAAYLGSNWRYQLTRAGGETYRVHNGLLSTTESNIEIARVRGVQRRQSMLLRWTKAGKLSALVSGVGEDSADTSLTPVAPEESLSQVARQVLGDSEPLDQQLQPHGRVAARRRYSRALMGFAPFAIAWGAAIYYFEWASWWYALAVIPFLLALPLARARYRQLGYGSSGHYLLSSSGALVNSRIALEHEAIIGWNIDQSFFQRRAGVANLTATTSAGQGGYTLVDLPLEIATRVASQATPGLLDELLR